MHRGRGQRRGRRVCVRGELVPAGELPGVCAEVAVLLNITPDHLYWHMTFEAYAEAKKKVYANLSKNQGTLVIDAVCDVTRDCVKEFKNDPKRAFGYIPVGCAAGHRPFHEGGLRV